MRLTLRANSKNLRETVIWDIDGVLCNSWEQMLPLINRGKSGDHWSNFNPHDCPPHDGWKQLCHMLYEAGYCTIILSSRTESTRQRTEFWLRTHGIRYDLLVMRPDNVRRAGFKAATIEDLKKEFNILLGIDDEEDHCKEYTEAGIPHLNAAPPYH